MVNFIFSLTGPWNAPIKYYFCMCQERSFQMRSAFELVDLVKITFSNVGRQASSNGAQNKKQRKEGLAPLASWLFAGNTLCGLELHHLLLWLSGLQTPRGFTPLTLLGLQLTQQIRRLLSLHNHVRQFFSKSLHIHISSIS